MIRLIITLIIALIISLIISLKNNKRIRKIISKVISIMSSSIAINLFVMFCVFFTLISIADAVLTRIFSYEKQFYTDMDKFAAISLICALIWFLINRKSIINSDQAAKTQNKFDSRKDDSPKPEQM